MVDKNIDINLNARDTGLERMRKNINKVTVSVRESANQFKFLNETIAMSNKAGVARLFDGMNKGAKTLGERLRALTGPFLSLLFFGMMLMNVAKQALISIFEGYKKAIPEASKFNVLTNKLSANWEYFKFQLADALANSSLFQKFIQFTVSILQWLQNLSPATKTFLMALLASTVVLGLMLMTIGQIGLGMQGLVTFSEILGPKLKALGWGGLVKYGWIALATAAIWGMSKALDAFYSSSEVGTNAQKNLKRAVLDTINSAFKPLAEAFNINWTGLNNWNELMIIAGVTIHNAILLILELIDVVIFLGRTLINISSIAISPMITAIQSLAKAIMKIIEGDWAGALDAGSDYFSDLKDNVLGDIGDITDAFATLKTNFTTKALSLEGYGPAIDAYRAEVGKQESINTTNNYTVVTMSDALAQGQITPEQTNGLASLGVTLI